MYQNNWSISHCKTSLCIFFVLIIACSMLMLLFSTCTTNPVQTTVTGTLSLEAETDNSGIIVEFFNVDTLVSPYTEIHEITTTLNVNVDDSRFFDHRDYVPVVRVSSDISGVFNAKLDQGIYHVVFRKNGFGFKYYFNILISDSICDLNTLLASQERVLHPDIEMFGVIMGQNLVFSKDHHLVVSDDLVFSNDTSVYFEPGTVVRINPGKKIIFSGTTELVGSSLSPIKFTNNSSDDMMLENNESVFDRITFTEEAIIMNNIVSDIVVTHSLLGIVLYREFNLSDSFVSADYQCLTGSNVQSIFVRNCLFENSASSQSYAVDALQCLQVDIQNSIIIKGQQGLKLSIASTGIVRNNFFNNAIQNLLIEHDSNVTVSYNVFRGANNSIKVYNTSQVDLLYNDIEASTCIWYMGSYTGGLVNQNNIRAVNRGIVFDALRYGDMDATNNYWNTSVVSEIESLIIDKSDYQPDHQNYSLMNDVIFQPYRTYPVANAGNY